MNWFSSFLTAMILLTVSILWSVLLVRNRRNRGRFLTPIKLLFGGLFLATLTVLCPIYRNTLDQSPYSGLEAFLLSVHATFQVFTIDADRSIILEMITCDEDWLRTAYTVFISVAYVAGPILTFGFVITFFRNVTAFFRYLLSFCRDAYVFSEMNERTILLAKSIRKNHRGATIVFTDVFGDDEEEQYERLQQAEEIRAICFKKDILTIDFRFRLPKKELTFFIMGTNETENVEQTISLIETFSKRPRTSLYVLSNGVEGELLLTAANCGCVKVHRVNEARTLINQTLLERGHELFDSAKEIEGEQEKRISVLLLGLGQYGTEMLKALSWYCQMDGYTFQADVFDADPQAEDVFSGECPELMSEAFSGTRIPGEMICTIRFHSGMDMRTKQFAQAVSELKDTTYAFVSLGSDAKNLAGAAELRMLFERMHIKPVIHTILHNSREKAVLEGITNFKGEAYDITFIGDLEESYSESSIINSELEQEALAQHMKWGAEEDFWKYEYNYNSSIAAALHLRAKIYCGIPGTEMTEEELRENGILERYEALEHRRWNAYTRSIGYIFGGTIEKAGRNDLGKMHNLLVEYDRLPEQQKRKDSRVGTRPKKRENT